MKHFIETIRLENNRLHLIQLHQQRMAATIRELYGSHAKIPSLEEALRSAISVYDNRLYKCRVIYDTDIRQIDIEAYKSRTIRSLKLVYASSDLDYHLKSADRSALDLLRSGKGLCDEVIIVRDGLITDTSYTNLIFTNSVDMFTPVTPLLEGTMRKYLLNQGHLTTLDLTPADIRPGNSLGITHAILINAMMPLERAISVHVSDIY